MKNQHILSGTVHNVTPEDLKKTLRADAAMFAAWQDITPLARNEFICWITSAKQDKTRARRIRIAQDKLNRGERRPCCWIGCTHRTDKPISPSVKGVLSRQSSK